MLSILLRVRVKHPNRPCLLQSCIQELPITPVSFRQQLFEPQSIRSQSTLFMVAQGFRLPHKHLRGSRTTVALFFPHRLDFDPFSDLILALNQAHLTIPAVTRGRIKKMHRQIRSLHETLHLSVGKVRGLPLGNHFYPIPLEILSQVLSCFTSFRLNPGRKR